MSKEGLAQAVARMTERGVDPLAIHAFEDAYAQLESGKAGIIPEDDIEPLRDVTTLESIAADDDQTVQALARTAVIKLNGGLGTSMGLSGPKSVLEVRDGLTFLDVVARQVLALRARHDVQVPLVLMDSFRTRQESLAALAAYPDLAVDGLPLDFLQNAEPKLRADDLTPVSWPDDPDLEWCPPGHGDVYVALMASRVLAALRDKGFRYAFLSNSDNLGATCDPAIPAWMARESIPYVSEVCDRTLNDRKGGHLAVRRSDGRVVLRESAMVAPEDQEHFQDTRRHSLFHANNLWVDLDALDAQMSARDGVLGLPIIINRKTVDPRRPDSTPVIQLESAMGMAIEVFDGSRALHVPRSRFRPVKTTNELLLLRSDLYGFGEEFEVVARSTRPDPRVDLDKHYTQIKQFDARFPGGSPSMIDCTSLTVRGDVTFGAGIRCVGEVVVEADEPFTVPDGTTLTATATVADILGDTVAEGATTS
ncbi:UTP--glucose-1-phosphate uridylyltransferase [Phycicoccus badiiscoriae]|uniref:UTP--glucose-1-phosphate uridylyltransferase n=1 Tax=Pedococcus badiiscoriae TaxID=642776 RepID=A0A852WEY5_9MICO|nr:UTP--glucose-1-phosphate uridylyltransferase [Pedococcus badiiscoriae]NYG07320.1 UTP--glucose-1-phosphate uridylyltransferase [Pedococcus badiiscoriae]